MAKISDLFRWKKEVALKLGDKNIAKYYVRVVGDADFSAARNKALKSSRELRIKLRTEGSDEFDAMFCDLGVLTPDEMANGIIASEAADFSDEALITIKEEKVPELEENPTLEQQEDHLAKHDSARTKRIHEVAKFIDGKIKVRREELVKLPKEELTKLYTSSIVDGECTKLFTTIFREYCIFKGTFIDAGYSEPAFSSFEEFHESNINLKTQLMTAYIELEISGDQLKN